MRFKVPRRYPCLKKTAFTALFALATIYTVSAADGSKNAKVTLVFNHELPNVPGKSMRGVLVEYGPADTRPPTHMPRAPSSTRLF